MKKFKMLIILSVLVLSVSGCSNADDELEEKEPEVQEEVELEEETDETNETEDLESQSSIEELSDDLYSFQVSVNDVIYQFPMSFDTFESLGWEYKENPNESIDSGSYLVAQLAEFDDFKVLVDVINFSPEAREVKDSHIGGMTFEKYYLGDSDVEIVLPGGITFNESTLEDIESAYGKPSDIYEADSETVYSYGADMYEEIKFTVFKDTGVLDIVEMRNFAEPDDLADAEVVTDTPEKIANYKHPKSVGNDLFDYHVEYDGIIYQMPIPLAKLIENGWKYEGNDEEALASGSFSTINLMKDNQTVRCHLMNYFDFVTIPENTHVTEIESRIDGPNIPIELSHGISLGMNKKELEKVIDSYDYEVEENSMFTSYRIDDPDVVNSGFTLLVDAETDEISSIIIQYDPRTLD